PALKPDSDLVESEIKGVEQLLDAEPLLTPQVLEIAHWVADYYAAPPGEVLKAALPAGINTTIEEIVSITERGRAEQSAIRNPQSAIGKYSDRKSDARNRALRLLADEGEFEMKTFCLRLGVIRTPRWLRELEQNGLIERRYGARSVVTRPKRRRAVRL